MFKKLKTYFKSKEKLLDTLQSKEEKLESKEDQITKMHELIMEQRRENHNLKRQLKIAEQMWDISNNQKTY